MNVNVAGACAVKRLRARSVVRFTPWIAPIVVSRDGVLYFFVLQSLLARFHSHFLIAYLAHSSLQHNLQRAHDREVRAVQDTLFHKVCRECATDGRINGINRARREHTSSGVVRDLKLDTLSSTRGETECVLVFA